MSDRTNRGPLPPEGRARSLYSRRRFLRHAVLGGFAAGLAACGARDTPDMPEAPGEAADMNAPATRPSEGPSSARRRPAESEAAGGRIAAAELHPPLVGTGEAALLTLDAPGAHAATLVREGLRYPLVRDAAGNGRFWGIVGVALAAEPGNRRLLVRTADGAGAPLDEREMAYRAVEVGRPVDRLGGAASAMGFAADETTLIEHQLRREQFEESSSEPLWDGAFRSPLWGRVTTVFGLGRSLNGGPVSSHHTGIDIAGDHGTPIWAAAPGRVSWVGSMPIRGRSVILDHGAGVKSGYHHLSTIEVEPGDLVPVGRRLGGVGSTGFSTGPHLHWEVTVWGVNVDPSAWMHHDFRPRPA